MQDLTKGYRVNDIENVVLGAIQRRAGPAEGCRQGLRRLRAAARHCRKGSPTSDVVLAIVVMGRTFHTNDVVPAIKAEIDKTECATASLPPGVRLVSYYDRTTLVVGHHPHSAEQPHLRLRAGFLHPVDISRQSAQRHHRRRQYSFRAVLCRHHHGIEGTGCQFALGRRGRFRHHRRFGGDPGREHFQEFPSEPCRATELAAAARRTGALVPIRPIRPIRDRPAHGRTGCGSFWPARCRSTRRYSSRR